MSLKKDVALDSGIAVDDCYIKVDQITIVFKFTMRFNAKFYQDENSEQGFYNQYFACNYDVEGANPFAQAYEYLKQQPEFQGAVNV